jgi:hypothetical protein
MSIAGLGFLLRGLGGRRLGCGGLRGPILVEIWLVCGLVWMVGGCGFGSVRWFGGCGGLLVRDRGGTRGITYAVVVLD